MVEKKSKKIRARPSPPLFGQCPKEIDFSYGRCSLNPFRIHSLCSAAFIVVINSIQLIFTLLVMKIVQHKYLKVTAIT